MGLFSFLLLGMYKFLNRKEAAIKRKRKSSGRKRKKNKNGEMNEET